MGTSIDLAPSVYEHAAALIHETPWRVSRDPECLFRAHAEAFRVYRHAPVVVGVDIYNLEAEAYGATIVEPVGNGIPSISSHPCAASDDITKLGVFDPRRDGRIPMVIGVGKRLAKALPGADVRIPVSGPFSLACNLVGFDRLLCDVLDQPRSVQRALGHLAVGQIAFAREIASEGLGIAFFESGATPPLISPEVFEEMELPVLRHILREASSGTGCSVPCIIGGNTLPVLDSILGTGTGYIVCPYETDQELFMRHMEAYPDVMVRINTDPGVFAGRDSSAVLREMDRVLGLARTRQKVCVGTGVLPFDADPVLVLMAKQFVRQKTMDRQSSLSGDGKLRPDSA